MIVRLVGLCLGLGFTATAWAQPWRPIPIVTADAAKAGLNPGGEGGQWFRDIAIAPSDPNVLLFATDVGGLYRSLDGGNRWEPCNVGFDARGAIALAIDPRNAKRAVVVAGNSTDWDPTWGATVHGVYLTEDNGASWKHVLPRNEGVGSAFDGNGAIAYDPSSYDAATECCLRIYFVPRDGGLFRSDDGGATWNEVQPKGFGNARLKVDDDGKVYLAGSSSVESGKTRGVYRSENLGRSFTRFLDDPVDGLDIEHGTIYISGAFGARLSRNGAITFGPPFRLNGIDRQNDKPLLNLTVSPADRNRMAAWIQGDNWKWVRYLSRDGGINWVASTWDNTNAILAFNVRQGHWAFDPKNAQSVFSVGGDWITHSTDGGQTFKYAANGYTGIMVGHAFNFSATSPDTLALFFQDYNGAVTRDAGKTWTLYDISGKGWGGYCYGGFTPDGNTIFGGDAESWNAPRRLRLSSDGGKTWAFAKDAIGQPIVFAGLDVSFADPRQPTTLFASNFRSADNGRSWSAMADCDGVFTASAGRDRALYGAKNDRVVRSDNGGQTWIAATQSAGGKIDDVAFDHDRSRIYAAVEGRLMVYSVGRWQTLDTPPDQRNGRHIVSVAVDPTSPNIVYAVGPANIYKSSASVLRSTDSGVSWTNLTSGEALKTLAQDGANEAQWVRVHPKTREAWVNGQCYGMWAIEPPK